MTSLLQTRFGMFSARADRGRPGLPKSDFLSIQSHWSVVFLTFIPAYASLIPMTAPLQTGSGMLSARAGRCQPKSDFLSIRATRRHFTPRLPPVRPSP
jgi:hypothetical protein